MRQAPTAGSSRRAFGRWGAPAISGFGRLFFNRASHPSKGAPKIVSPDPTVPAASAQPWETLRSHWEKLPGQETVFAKTPVTHGAGAGIVRDS